MQEALAEPENTNTLRNTKHVKIGRVSPSELAETNITNKMCVLNKMDKFGSPKRRVRTRRATSPGFGRGDYRGNSLMERSRRALLAASRRTSRKFAANAIKANALKNKRKKSWL